MSQQQKYLEAVLEIIQLKCLFPFQKFYLDIFEEKLHI